MFRCLLFLIIVSLVFPVSSPAAVDPSVKNNFTQTDIQGGFVVHLGCGTGALTVDLGRSEKYIVHGLDRDEKNIAAARLMIHQQGLAGRVSAEVLSTDWLPYADNMVNLLVAEDLAGIDMEEVFRVLTPRGVVYVKKEGKWIRHIKPVPETMDDWTHYLYDASNNALSQDEIKPPLRTLQWICGPKWTRSHNAMSSLPALVSSAGRIFYILDEGPSSSLAMPSKWSLIARDAFNGVLLWKRPLENWMSHYYGLKSGPTQLPRRLVAVKDKVYVTLGFVAPLSKLDAVTGDLIKTYEGTEGTEEVLVSGKTLFLTTKSGQDIKSLEDTHSQFLYTGNWGIKYSSPKRLIAVDDDSETILWVKEYRIAPVTLAADASQLYFFDGESIVAVSRMNGDQIWKSLPVKGESNIPTGTTPTLVVKDGVILFSALKEELTALDVENGEILWTSPFAKENYASPADIFVVDGKVWGADLRDKAPQKNRPPPKNGKPRKSSTGIFTGRDLKTGEVKSQFPPDVDYNWFHHRCHRAKATKNFFLTSRTGIEFVDFRNQTWTPHNWARGGCLNGIMPANGLIYAPPHPCSCFMESKIEGVSAVGEKSSIPLEERTILDTDRLQKGRAYTGKAAGSSTENDWPTYRHDVERSGSTPIKLSLNMTTSWQADLGGTLSGLIYGEDTVFVSSIDAHVVYALDASSGEVVWKYPVGGRVDSAPTLYKGCVYFGSRDGWVYCVRASDGELVWRFLAAAAHQKIISYGQLESVWPVHGNILIVNDILYCVAGRLTFLEGGLQFYQLNPLTGEIISKNISDNFTAEDQDKLTDVGLLTLPTAAPDILSCDGKYIYMRSRRFDMDDFLTNPKNPKDYYGAPHIFSSSGFLDTTWFHRTYWLANVKSRAMAMGGSSGNAREKGVFAARILSKNGSDLYGFGRAQREFYVFGNKVSYHHLYAADLSQPKSDYRWSVNIPLLVYSMVLADQTLFVAGPPDLLGETELEMKTVIKKRTVPTDELLAKMDEQNASLAGEKGALLWAVSTQDGQKTASMDLVAPPVFDGMIAGGGKLFVALENGMVICIK